MSLILDALNRSRGDESSVPGLATEHTLPIARESHLFQWVAVAALVLAAGLIFYLLLDRQAAEVPESRTASTTRQAPALESEPVKNVSAPPPVSAPQPAPRQAPEVSIPVSSPAASDKASPVVDPAVAALYQNDSGTSAPPREVETRRVARAAPQKKEESVDIEKMILQARTELEDASLDEHPAPFISDISQQSKDRIPTIYYQRHDYSDVSGQSTVLLNSKTVRPGEQLGSGVKVDEILPDSAVLSYEGTQFRLRALNSWINL